MTDPISPQEDAALIAKLAAMTTDEFAAVVNKARGSDAAIQAAESRGDWRTSMALKQRRLSELMTPTLINIKTEE